MKDKILELYNAGFDANRIAAQLMIQKTEVERIVNNADAKKNSTETIPVAAVETSKKKKK